MENMREYWAREAEMMRDKSGVLGNNSLSQSPSRNEQNTVKGTITFASEFKGSVGAELVSIASTTSFYKDYVTQLEKQFAYDTYVFTYPAMFIYPTGNGQPASKLYFDNKGFITGEGTRGRTILLTDENDYKQQTGPIGDPSNSYILQRVKLASIKSSFDNKKKVIMVVIANQFLNPEAYPLKKEDLDNLKKKTPLTEYILCCNRFCAFAVTLIKVILLLASLAKREKMWFIFRQSRKMNHLPLFCEQSEQ